MNKKNINQVRKRLYGWYKINRREFSWRYNINPYRIMIAEFMLQRTKAEQVAPIYNRFINRYPNIISLSRANNTNIKKYTLNLGLHKRAKNFIDAATYIKNNYDGKIPKVREEILKIPGVGDYVAGAILTVAFNKKEYVIDSNIARFINRFYGFNLKGEIRRKKIIVEKSKDIFKSSVPGRLLFCLLDFTALICKPINPKCNICVIKKYCVFS